MRGLDGADWRGWARFALLLLLFFLLLFCPCTGKGASSSVAANTRNRGGTFFIFRGGFYELTTKGAMYWTSRESPVFNSFLSFASRRDRAGSAGDTFSPRKRGLTLSCDPVESRHAPPHSF